MKECEDYCLVIVSRVQQCYYISNKRTYIAVCVCTRIRIYVLYHKSRGMGDVQEQNAQRWESKRSVNALS